MQLINNRYQMIDQLGAGGMGAVYRVKDRLTGDTVALKRVTMTLDQFDLTPGRSLSDHRLALAIEFRTLAGLRHPHIVSVLDYGFDSESHPFFTMEYLAQAQTITGAATKADPATRIRFIVQALQALHYLHRRGVIHRDLKPDNVLVSHEGSVKLLDFGLALDTKDSDDMDDEVVGTIAYMSPELLMGFPATVQSDMYAMGMIAYQVLKGSYPFNQDNVANLINSVLEETPDVSGLDDELADILAALLDKEADKRPSDCTDLIRRFYAGADLPVPPESITVRESFLQASSFVGRALEIHQLHLAVDYLTGADDAPPDSPCFFLIGGEAGVGKSRLVEELRSWALVRGALVLRGQGVSNGGLPFQLWRDAVRRLVLETALDDLEAAILKAIVPDISDLMGKDIPDAPELSGSAFQQRLRLTIVDLFKRQTQPIVLILEDLHWASLETIQQMMSIQDQFDKLIIVATYRSDETPDLPHELPGFEVMMLHRLDDDAITDLSVSMLGETGSQPQILELLKRETEGNAFFMVEVVRALAEETGRLTDISQDTLPQTVVAGGVQQIIRRRLSHVPDWAQPMLKLAAVAGRKIDEAVLSADVDVPVAVTLTDHTLEQWLNACADAAALEVQDNQWRFSHDKIREVLLADLKDDERSQLNRQIAAGIEAVYPDDNTYAEPLLEHWHNAGDVEKALHYVLIVAQQLIDIKAQYEKALALLDRSLKQIREDHPRYAKLMYLSSRAHWHLAYYQVAVTYAEKARDAAQASGDQQTMAESVNSLGAVAFNQGNFDTARDYFQQSREIYDSLDNRKGISGALNNLGLIAANLGDFPSAKDYFEESLKLSEEIDDRHGMTFTLHNLGLVADLLDDTDTARAYLERSLYICREIGDRNGIAGSTNSLGMIAAAQGQPDTARTYLKQGEAICREIGDLWGVTSSLVNQGFIDLSDAESAGQFREALAIALQINAQPLALQALTGFAYLKLKAGDVPEAGRIAGMIAEHPARTEDVDRQFEALLDELKAAFADEAAYTTALAGGQSLQLEDVIAQMLV